MFKLPKDTDRRKPPAPNRQTRTNAKGDKVYTTKNSDGSRTRNVTKKNGDTVTSKIKGGKVISKERTLRNADGSHKKTVTKKADGSRSVRKYKKGKTFTDTKTITRTTDKAGNKSRTVSNFGKKNKKGETTSTTRTKDSKGKVTTKRDIYTKNKKGEAIVKTKTKGPDGKKTISRRKDPPMNSFGRTGGTFATSNTGPRPSQPKPKPTTTTTKRTGSVGTKRCDYPKKK